MINDKQSKAGKQNNKGLQKFTDFESIKTKEDILKLQEEKGKDELEKLANWVVVKLNEVINTKEPEAGALDKYYNSFESIIELIRPSSLEATKRTRWQVNKHKIENVMHKSLLENNRLPAQSEIAEKTGLSRVTISKHIKEGSGSEMQNDERESYKLMAGNVLAALYKIGMLNEDVKALKVYLDYFKDSTSGPATIKQQNNYLQFNNTRIDEVTVNQLPEDARLQIENIIKQYQTT